MSLIESIIKYSTLSILENNPLITFTFLEVFHGSIKLPTVDWYLGVKVAWADALITGSSPLLRSRQWSLVLPEER